ncbi:hypothetical protein [Campylobacter upsaliensis]|uniref:hypothetical protein n=1 Tax=Campylobacter upsaliensis TaxID=28080 RepID=UPI0022EAEE40|nr:hypothetical protein [Campylobacter upsaliensis]
MPIIIIESPNKTEKISKYSGFKTIATKGHFKALSKDIFIPEKKRNMSLNLLALIKIALTALMKLSMLLKMKKFLSQQTLIERVMP